MPSSLITVKKNTIFYATKNTLLECNNLIYTYATEEYEAFKIIGIPNQDILQCHPIGLFPITYKETPQLQWNKVGVFKHGGISDDIVNILTRKVAGKILNVMGLFITCPNNVLREK